MTGGNDSHLKFYPVSLQDDNIAFFDHSEKIARSYDWQKDDFAQTIDRHPLFYGKSLDAPLAAADPFYAVHELFALSAASMLVLLNAIAAHLDQHKAKLREANAQSLLDSQADIVYFKAILQSHLKHIDSTCRTIRSRDVLSWNQVTEPKYIKPAKIAARRLEDDWTFLAQKATDLVRSCDQDMTVLMTQTALEEAKRNAKQAGRVVRLTLLATVFIPLAFTSSLFGMNFVKFDSLRQGVWVWIAVTVPIFLASFLAITWDRRWSEVWLQSSWQVRRLSKPKTSRSIEVGTNEKANLSFSSLRKKMSAGGDSYC
jgi:hypothetical protein